MRTIFLIIIILCISVECFADTNATLAKEAVPAYNACNGEFVELLEGEAMTVLIIFSEGTLVEGGLLIGEAMVIEVLFADGTLSTITNATALIESPPIYNECDGAFLEVLEGEGVTVSIIFSEGVLNDLKLHGEIMTVTISIPSNEQKITFGQGIEFEQGIDFYGHNIKWKARPSAALLGP